MYVCMYMCLCVQAVISVWRRYGSMGGVIVRGVASGLAASSLPADTIAAVPSEDFITTTLSISMGEGVTTSSFSVDLPDNSLPSALKAFQFTLLSVESDPAQTTPTGSPRLSSVNTSATVVILDDEGGTGVFQLRPLASNATEGSQVVLEVQRSRGTSGRVAVRVQTIEMGGATSNVDFLSSDQVLVFENGQSTRPVVLNVFDDTLPEFSESFGVLLSAPNGQNVLIDPNSVSQYTR